MRLFLALMPPPGLRERLGALADAAHARCGGRRMPDASLHLTLSVRDRVHLARIIKRLRNLSHVERITRLGN